jgi:hypothetical protein
MSIKRINSIGTADRALLANLRWEPVYYGTGLRGVGEQ